jgi:hypothetical protein
VEGILDGRQPKGLRLAEMLGNGLVAWEEQQSVWGLARGSAFVLSAQKIAALPLAPARILDDRHDLSPMLVPAVALGMILQPAIDELGRPLGQPLLLDGSRMGAGSGSADASAYPQRDPDRDPSSRAPTNIGAGDGDPAR